MQYSIINCSHYDLMTYLFYNWKFVHFDPLTNFTYPHISESIYYLSICLWLISLSIIPLGYIHAVKRQYFDLIFGWLIFHCVCVCISHFSLSINLLMDTGCFCILSIVDNPTMNMTGLCMQISFRISISFFPSSLDKYCEMELLDHIVVLFFIFLRPPHCFL